MMTLIKMLGFGFFCFVMGVAYALDNSKKN
jgi:hypothetical protein